MCNATASLAGQAFGVGSSTVGAFAGAKAQQASLRSQARIAEINATLADAAARGELMASERQQNQIKLKGAQLKASQRAATAANGIDIGVGTPVDIATSTDYVTEVDSNTAAANGIQAAWGRRIQAGNYRREATSARASAAGISPGMAAATTLITGASQVAQSWYSLNKVGAFGGQGGGAQQSTWGQPGHESRLTDTWANGAFGYNSDGMRIRF